MKKKRRLEGLLAYAFLAPFIIFTAVFMIYPIVQQFFRSLVDTKWGGIIQFVGLDNFITIFTTDYYLKGIINTLLFVVCAVPLIIGLGFFIAASIFDKKRTYVSGVRIILYIPTIVSMVVMSSIWKFMLNSQNGLIAYIAGLMGFESVDLLASGTSAKVIIIIVLVLVNIGQCVLLYVAQMIGISGDLLDACRVDGGKRWHLFRYILFPLCKSTTILVFITNTSLVLKVYVVIQLLTAGGPNYATTTIMYQLYEDAFNRGNVGTASALGVILFLITLLLISARFAVERREGDER